MTDITTFVQDGRHYFVCETCSTKCRLDTPQTKCKQCGAWYKVTIEQTIEGQTYD